MTKQQILIETEKQFSLCAANTVSADAAISPEMAGLQIYEAPLVGFASAADSLFAEFKRPEVIGPHFMSPEEWLPGAKTVISFFFPFTERVRKSTRALSDGPSPEWLHGRIEGQACLTSFISALKKVFDEAGIESCVPVTDSRFNQQGFASCWSERHIAYACGLGTFGLSKGLITEKGIAGRFISIIISESIEPDVRPYSGIYDYCSMCGACVRRCPVGAISLKTGKNHPLCAQFQQKMGAIHAPRYGCGLCQTAVPCEHARPVK